MPKAAFDCTTPRRRRFSFGLRSLLVFVTLVAVVVAWIGHERRQSRHELAIVEMLEANGASFTFAGPFDAQWPYSSPDGQSWWRRWLNDAVGPRVEMLSLKETDVADLSPVAGLRSLKYLYLDDTEITDLAPISGL